jgi:hypothetical protein
MKHLQHLSPGARKALAAALIIAAVYPAPINLALHYATGIALAIAAVLLLRVHPAGSHKTLTAVRIHPMVATAITGHKQPQPAPARSYKHAPSSGPQVPVQNPTTN